MVANQTNNENNRPIPPSYLTQPRVRGIKVGAQTSPSHSHFPSVLLSFFCISHTPTSSDIDFTSGKGWTERESGTKAGQGKTLPLAFVILLTFAYVGWRRSPCKQQIRLYVLPSQFYARLLYAMVVLRSCLLLSLHPFFHFTADRIVHRIEVV